MRLIDVIKFVQDNPILPSNVLVALSKAPTIEAEPVVHARWGKVYRSKVTVTDGYISSCCDMWNERRTPYCPNCGAKMDLEG